MLEERFTKKSEQGGKQQKKEMFTLKLPVVVLEDIQAQRSMLRQMLVLAIKMVIAMTHFDSQWGEENGIASKIQITIRLPFVIRRKMGRSDNFAASPC